MKTTMKILITGVLFTLLLSACSNLFEPNDSTDGNVTITFDAGQAGRTIRPNNIAAVSAFERIELEFVKGSGADALIKTANVNKGTASYTTSLETGSWNINARGFMKIENREYEAARGSAVVTVGSIPQTVGIVLQTGILDDRPGVFGYNISFPDTVTGAVLEISSLPDLYGYDIPTDGKTIDLLNGKAGSFDLLAGYYLLTLSAKTSASMAVWNELVHIYSGQKTDVSHTFVTADFSGMMTLSGTVVGGEFESNHITKAVLTAYGDENFTSRIASVNIPSFTKMAAAPFYYSGSWSMTVPGSLAEKDIYFRVEETLGGPAGTRTHVWDRYMPVNVSGTTSGINWDTSYTWGTWIFNDNYDAVDYTVGADGTVSVTTTQVVINEWDGWQQQLSFTFPAENDIRYAYEFEAWTLSGTRPLSVQYIENSKYEIYQSKEFTIDTTHTTFTIISNTPFDPNVRNQLAFQLGHTSTGTLYLKIKSIQPAIEYIPPGTDPRLTATAATGGIQLKADLKGLPNELRGLMFFEEGTSTYFYTGWIWDPQGTLHPDTYEFLFPYVQAGKEYTFRLEYQVDDIILGRPKATTTATGGRGEVYFTNASELAVVKEGDTVKFNKAPVLSTFTDTGATNKHYVFQIVKGTSWIDPLAEWKYEHSMTISTSSVNLIDVLDELDDWVDIPSFLGKTCFAGIYYSFTYDNNDIYILGHPVGERGSFNITTICSTPFTYPNVLPGAFTATSHAEGVKLIVDLSKIPASATALRFLPLNDNATQCWVGSYEWEYDWGSLYGSDTVEIIYPFVQAGKTYTFQVEYEGTGAWGQATVTTTAGLGELYITNPANLGLIYQNKTKTLSFTEKPTASINKSASANIERVYWDWQFYKGYNWSGFEWAGAIGIDEPVASVGPLLLDETFDPLLGSDLSETVVFANVTYSIVYKGWTFSAPVATSPSFRFPYFEHVEKVDTEIKTAFDTNRDLSLFYNGSVGQGYSLDAYVYYWGNGNISSYAWFIDGVKKEVDTNSVDWYAVSASLPTTELLPGMHYGLVVVTIDGAVFAQEFAFRVTE